MTRTADLGRRAALLERIVDYAAEHGLSEISLRPLAKAVGSSPRVLLYYFKSKDELMVEVMTLARKRQHALLANLQLNPGMSARQACSLCWRAISDRRQEPLYQLFFEIYAIAMRDPARFPGFLERSVGDWLDFVAAPAMAAGAARERAYAYATMILAGFRGFLMDLCATHDHARIDAAVELWLDCTDVPFDTSLRRDDIA